MKQQTKITLTILLAILLGTAFGFKIEEQQFNIKIKATELNFIGQSLQGIKQAVATSKIPSDQGFEITGRIDSIVRIINKGMITPKVDVPENTTKKNKVKKDTTKSK
jgi:hypothetical protein